MAEVVLFHHAQGLTRGVHVFADDLRAAGHTVHTPDLYAGRTFDTLRAGIAHSDELGVDTIVRRGADAVAALGADVVYAGMSLGVIPAQRLAQTRAGARGALLLHSFVPPDYFGPWPEGLPAQIHAMDADPVFVGEGDIEAAQECARRHHGVRLLLYPGDRHLFADRSLPSYDAAAAALLTARVLDFLATIADRPGLRSGLGLTLECRDAARLADFWKQAAGYADDPAPAEPHSETGPHTAYLCDPRGLLPALVLQEVERRRPGGRVRLDLVVSGADDIGGQWDRVVAEATRLAALGARTTAVHADELIAMADPEGNPLTLR